MASIDVPDGDNPEQQVDPLVRMAALRPLIGNVAPSTVWRWVEQGRFPQPVRLGDNCVGWRTKDIAAWIESRQPAAAKPERRRGGRRRSSETRATSTGGKTTASRA